MRILFLHSSFPGQFLFLAHFLAANGHQVAFVTADEAAHELPGVRRVCYKMSRGPSPHTHHYLRGLERAVLEGQAAYGAAEKLKEQGFVPDVIVAHSGWGPGLYMKDLFPQSVLISYFEWYYRAHGSDADFGPEETLTPDDECRIRAKNGPILLDLYSCDAGISPTWWQHSQFPGEYAQKIQVIHDGVNTETSKPQLGRKLVLPRLGLDLSDKQEIVTYVARGMEPYRGFPQFMEAVALLQKRRPHCQVVIVGGDGVYYGAPPTGGGSWKDKILAELPLDRSRLHFTGYLDRQEFLTALQASTVHVYLTRPFILSWSMLEAMACGCTLVASATQPVQEVVVDGVNGLLADFFAPQQLADKVEDALTDASLRKTLSYRARETILERYDLRMVLPRQLALLQQVIEAGRSARR